jgi:hypothetical protein
MNARVWFVLLAASILAPCLMGQWVKPAAKVDLNGPAPRTGDGKPDLSGFWTSAVKFNSNLATDLAPDAVKMTPWGQALYDQRVATNSQSDPENVCLPSGTPRINAAGGFPNRILQTPGMVVILYEIKMLYRTVFLDGRTVQKEANPTWMGYSTGSWDGDTLVVRTTGFNDKTWLDDRGHPHSESLVVTERYRRPDYGHLFIDITIEDPVAYKEPWTVTEDLRLDPDGDLIEYVCIENERDARHLVAK